jgi:hypothetical protein
MTCSLKVTTAATQHGVPDTWIKGLLIAPVEQRHRGPSRKRSSTQRCTRCRIGHVAAERRKRADLPMSASWLILCLCAGGHSHVGRTANCSVLCLSNTGLPP